MWRRGLDRLYLAAGALGAFFILVIAVLMVGQSLLREMGVRTGAVNDVVAWLCAAAAFLGMAHSFRNGDFVRVTLLLEAVPARLRRVLELTSLTVALVAIAYLAYWAARFTHESWVFNDIAGNMVAIPIWIPQLSFVVGAFIFVVAVADEWVCVLRGGKPSYVTCVEERHARGDFSEEL